MKKVLITGVGGNVGQGIIRCIKDYDSTIEVIGCSVEPFSEGVHLCNEYYQVPYANKDSFLPTMKSIVEKHEIDLIIPSTDNETYILSASDLYPISAVSPEKTSFTFIDKLETALYFKTHGIPFADACLPSEYKGEYGEIIVKPRKGRGSRSIVINPVDFDTYSSEFMVQKLHKGKELTCGVYVNKLGEIHGTIVFERELSNGTTKNCWVNSDYNEQFVSIAQKIVDSLEVKGSFNIQAIIENEIVVPFEINGRISGTNSIRHNLGFQDVVYTIQENLFNIKADVPNVIKGSATRILLDVIYPENNSLSTVSSNSKKHIF